MYYNRCDCSGLQYSILLKCGVFSRILAAVATFLDVIVILPVLILLTFYLFLKQFRSELSEALFVVAFFVVQVIA